MSSLLSDTQTAAQYIEILQQKLHNKGDHSQDDTLMSIACMLESPMFKKLLTLQESLAEVKHLSRTRPLTDESFGFTPSGELIVNDSGDSFTPDSVADSSTLKLRGRPFHPDEAPGVLGLGYSPEVEASIETVAAGRPIHVIELEKAEQRSLGFSVVGLRPQIDEATQEQGPLGIYVRDIQPGGIAAMDGQLQEGDQLLAVNGQALEVTHQEAIRILQGAGGIVQIVVARGHPYHQPVQHPVSEEPPIQAETAALAAAAVPGTAEGGEEEEDEQEEEEQEEQRGPDEEYLEEEFLAAGGQVDSAEDRDLQSLERSDMVLSTDWTQLEVIDLINDGTGLGFGIIGGRSTGVVVKTILPGGIADLDGHLHSGDHILQIGDVNVRGMGSEQVALVLRQSGSHVRLVVARPVMEPPQYQLPHAPVIPTHQLEEHMEHFNAVMALEAGEHEQHLQQLHLHNMQLQQQLQQLQQQQLQQQQTMLGSVQVHSQPNEVEPPPSDVDVFDVELAKDSNGLGITIAGYVGGDQTPDEISGIFVKSITEGSAAALDGRIHVNDQIIEVDGRSLQGHSNHQAVEVLRNTGHMVTLKLVRFTHGPKYDKLQEYLAQANQLVSPTTNAVSNPTYDLQSQQIDLEDVHITTEDYSGELSTESEAAIKEAWEPVVGSDFLVVVAQLAKFKEGGGLGISLEGTVDVEDGVEVRPHHYIRSILPDGPVGINGRLKSSDELLEVNGRRLLGLNHVSVVEILKELPQHVRLVCARRRSPDAFSSSQQPELSPAPPVKEYNELSPSSQPAERLVKAKSEMALSTTPDAASLTRAKSRSLEPLTGLAMWSSEPVVIELDKSDRGLGFSILDYQDPVNPGGTVIVIRSLVPGGVAQTDGRLVPGDRLVFVNDVNVEHATLDQAVQALKGAERGLVRIGVAKPLPLARQLPPFSVGDATEGSHDPADSTHHASRSDSEFVTPQEVMTPYDHIDTSPQAGLHNHNDDDDDDRKSLGSASTVSTASLTSGKLGGDISLSAAEVEEGEATPGDATANGLAYRRHDSFYESDEEDARSPRRHVRPPGYQAAVREVAPEPDIVVATTSLTLAAAPDTVERDQLSPISAAATPREDSLQNQTGASQEHLVDTTLPTHFETTVVTSSVQDLPSYDEALTAMTDTPTHAQAALEQPSGSPASSDTSSQSVGRSTKKTPPPIPPKPKGIRSSLLVYAQEKTSPRLGLSPRRSPASEQLNSSDLSTPPASPPVHGPEQTIHVRKGGLHLGLTLESVDKSAPGCAVKSIATGSAAELDGRLQPGDLILAVNNESLRRITSAQARAVLRRCSLLGEDVSITYISGAAVTRDPQVSSTGSTPSQSPLLQKLAQSLESEDPPTAATSPLITATIAATTSAPPPSRESRRSTSGTDDEGSRSGQKTLLTDGSTAVGNQAWGPPRSVALIREEGRSLGISIVGGRVDMFHVSQEHSNAGIFIKHVLPDSPAGRNGTLKKGDRILEVNGVDVRNATHDEAVEVIRNSSSPITFVVQSLSYSNPPGDLDSSQLKAVQSFEEGGTSASPTHLPPQAATTTTAPAATATSIMSAAPLLGTQTSLTSSSPGSTPQQSFEQGPDKLGGESFSDSEEEDEFGYTKKQVCRRYADLPGLVQLVSLDRGNAGMGLGLAGNKDRSKMSVFVAGIQPGSPAARDSRIQVGDELLEVNGVTLHGLSHLNASAVIKGITTPVVKLITHRRVDFQDHMAVKPLRYGGSSQFDAASVPPVTPDINQPATTTQNRRESAAAVSASPKTPKPALSSADTVQVITLQKNASHGLGFGIHEQVKNGRQGIYVKTITPGGIAEKDQQLEVGDEILEVGDKSLTGVSYDKATEILRTSQGQVRIKVCKSGQQNSLSPLQPVPQSGLQPPKIPLLNTVGESSTDPTDPDDPPSDPRTCPILPGRRTCIEIEKGKTGLGLSIVGGSDTLLGAIIIHEVYKDGAAARDGRLWAGDQILEVNGEDVSEASHQRALQVLRQTPPLVRMAVYRDEAQVREQDILDVFTIDLVKRHGKGLGLSIVGKKTDVGIYISDIVKGGVAEADGRLMQGDQILAVNGEDMRNSTQEYAAAVLKTLMGKVSLTVGRLKAGSKASSRKNSNPGTSLKKSDSSASNKSKGRHSKSNSEDASHIRVVELQQDQNGSFGLSVAGGVASPLGDVPVIVASLSQHGPAYNSGNIKAGDKILNINGVSTDGMEHAQVVAALRASPTVTLHVTQGEAVSITGQRSRQVSADMSDLPLEDVNIELEEDGPPPQYKTITLHRGPDGLGFSIVGGHGSPHGDLPIYVKTVFSKGAAADEGTLARGDQILTVNGQSLEGVTHEEAVNILKNTHREVALGILS